MATSEDIKKQIQTLKERAHLMERLAKNMELDLKTINVLIGHALSDLSQHWNKKDKEEMLLAAHKLCESIQSVSGAYI